MAQLTRALVPRFRRNPLGGPNVLLHLVGRASWKARGKNLPRINPDTVDGSQRWLFHRGETENSRSWTRATSLVPLGGGQHLAQRYASSRPCLLLEQRTH